MKKKILSLVLVVAMLASMLVLAPVSGATKFDGTVAVTNAYGFEGEPVSVDVVLTTDQPVYTFQFTFDYDKTKMTLDSVEFAPGFGFWPISGVEEVDEAMKVSPFDNIGWNRAVGADPIDASEGAVIATMNFTLNEDVLGDAYVSIVPSPINNIAIDSGEVGAMIYNFDYVPGSVTVLPEGYVSLTPTDESLFTFAEGAQDEDGEYVFEDEKSRKYIYSYDGEWGGTIVIPAGVTAISMAAFSGMNADTTIIVPETIDYLCMGAFDASSSKSSVTVTVIVLNNACVLESDTPFATAAKKGSFVVKSASESTVATHIADDAPTRVTWEALDNFNLTFNNETYYVPSNAAAPGMAVNGDQITVAWKIGDTAYLPGDTMTITEDTTLEPVTIAKPDMTSTYGFKPTDSPATTAMRFTTTLAKADYETFAGVAESLGGRVEMGTLITPARFVSKAGALTKEALDALSASNNNAQTYIDIDTTGKYFSLEDNIYTFAGSVYGFKGTNYNLDYAAAFYMSVVVGEGETEETLFTVYSDFEFANNRQPLAAAKAVYEVATTNAVKEAVLKFIQKYEPTYGEES